MVTDNDSPIIGDIWEPDQALVNTSRLPRLPSTSSHQSRIMSTAAYRHCFKWSYYMCGDDLNSSLKIKLFNFIWKLHLVNSFIPVAAMFQATNKFVCLITRVNTTYYILRRVTMETKVLQVKEDHLDHKLVFVSKIDRSMSSNWRKRTRYWVSYFTKEISHLLISIK